MVKESKKALVPKLRFPEFLGSAEWKAKRMDSLYSFMRNNTLSRDKLNYEAGTAKNIHYGDIHTKFSTLFDITKERVPYINLTEGLPDIDSDDYCVEGDLVFADSSEDTNDVGKCIEIVRLDKQHLLAGQHTILARQRNGEFVIGFGGSVFQSARVRSQIQHEAQGTKVYAISPTRLARIEVAYPSEEDEQQRIADCLSSLDELIAVQGRKVEALKTYKRGLMQQLFPREGETLPRLRFPEFRDAPEWEEALLGDLFDTSSGGTPDRTKREYWNGDIPWVTTSLVDFNVIAKADEFISELGLDNSSAKVFPKGTVLIAMYGQGITRGKVAVLGIPAATNQACAAILPNDEVDSGFTFVSLCGRYEEMRKLSNSGGQENLSQALIRALPFRYPKDVEEQTRVVECFSEIDTLIVGEGGKLDALKLHKEGLMQQLFPSVEDTK
jgi:type I restriction enzyme, S subunit